MIVISFRYLIAYKNLLRAIENIGIAVVYGIRYIMHMQGLSIFKLNLQKVLRHGEDNSWKLRPVHQVSLIFEPLN